MNNARRSIVHSMPVTDFYVGGKVIMGLLSTKCSKTSYFSREFGGSKTMDSFDGEMTHCIESALLLLILMR